MSSRDSDEADEAPAQGGTDADDTHYDDHLVDRLRWAHPRPSESRRH